MKGLWFLNRKLLPSIRKSTRVGSTTRFSAALLASTTLELLLARSTCY